MNATDRELLTLAAKAAGYDVRYVEGISSMHYTGFRINTGKAFFGIAANEYITWNPLEDDGDALRLAVKLNLLNTRATGYEWPVAELFLQHKDNPYAATRRAIVRAAAEIGRQMA
jgi:hypothetical protein